MSRFSKSLAIAFLGLLILAPGAFAQRRRVFIGGGFGYAGPGWYGYYNPYPGWGWGWGPYYNYYGYYGYAPAPNVGKVKIIADKKDTKDVSVYVDGGYAGLADKLKTFPLRPGKHDIELRDHDGHTFQQEQIEVIPGKTVDIDAEPHGR